MIPYTREEVQAAIEEALRRLGETPDASFWNNWVHGLLDELESKGSYDALGYYSAEQFEEVASQYADSVKRHLSIVRGVSHSLLRRKGGSLTDQQKESLGKLLKDAYEVELREDDLRCFARLVVDLLTGR